MTVGFFLPAFRSVEHRRASTLPGNYKPATDGDRYTDINSDPLDSKDSDFTATIAN
jgi:hypothetical protein